MAFFFGNRKKKTSLGKAKGDIGSNGTKKPDLKEALKDKSLSDVNDILENPEDDSSDAEYSPDEESPRVSAGCKEALRAVEEMFLGYDRKHVWAFNAGQGGGDFRGNPKYLFCYIARYRKDIAAYWIANDEETVEFVRSLGYTAYLTNTVEADAASDYTGVLVAEQVKLAIPEGMKKCIYLNLYHGVGAKDVERALLEGGMAGELAHKYIEHNQYYRNNQLFLTPSPMMEDDFMRMCGIDPDCTVRAGYPRNIYQKYFEKIETFDHDILKAKNLPADTKIAVYAPTYRQSMEGEVYACAIPDTKRLAKACEESGILLILKMHPLMEKEHGFLSARKLYGDEKGLYFWDNKDDIYEILDKIDLGVIDYSSIFTDMVSSGIRDFIRYVYDYDQEKEKLRHDYMKVTEGELCYDFEALLGAIRSFGDTGHTDTDQDHLSRIHDMYWEYSGRDTFDIIIEKTLSFSPKKRTLPTLYSFDVFDTLISRKGLDPKSIFYKVKEGLKDSGQDFPEWFIERYPRLREQAESNVRLAFARTVYEREDGRREIYMEDIFRRLGDVYGISQKQADYLMEAELLAELECTVPIKENIDRVKKLLSDNETVVLISDMYLPVEHVKKMLGKADSILEEIPLYLSSEVGVQKTTKEIFFRVYKDFKPFYDFGKWIHIGDNETADVKMPHQYGIVPRPVNTPSFGLYEEAMVRDIGTYDAYLAAAMIARFTHERIFEKDRFVYKYLSLCFFPYVHWVLNDAVKKGFEALYFISRDGHHLKRIADVIREKENLPIETGYIYASRKTWRVPSFIDGIDDDFWSGHGNFADVKTFDELLSAAMLTEEGFLRFFPGFSELKGRKDIDSDELELIINTLKGSKRYCDFVMEKAASLRELACGYLEQEIDASKKVAFVEYWGRGYTQTAFTKLWKHIRGADAKSHFYYARTVLPTQGDDIRYNFTTNPVELLFIEAFFANIPYGSIEAYEKKDGKIVPVIRNQTCDMELFDAMERNLVEFTKDILDIGILDFERMDRALFDFALNYFNENKEDKMFLENLAPLKDSVTMYGTLGEYAPALTKVHLDMMNEKVPRFKISKSMRMSAARALPGVRKQYMEMFQLNEGDSMDKGFYISPDSVEINRRFREKTQRLLEGQDEKQAVYDRICMGVPVENKILILADRKRDLRSGAFYSIKKILQENENGGDLGRPVKPPYEGEHEYKGYRIKLSFTGAYANDEELLEDVAASRFVVSTQVPKSLVRIRLRGESSLIMIGSSVFPYSDAPESLKDRYDHKRLLRSAENALVMYPSEELKPWLKERYSIQNADSFILKGSCQSDIYFDPMFAAKSRERLGKKTGFSEADKVILYMPSSRSMDRKTHYKNLFRMKILKANLPEEYKVVVYFPGERTYQDLEVDGFSRLLNPKVLHLREAVCAADIIIGDYREGFYETVLVEKPAILTDSDHDEFFYKKSTICPYEEVRIGPSVSTEEEAARLILDGIDVSPFEENRRLLREKYLTYCDGKSCERLLEWMVGN